MAIRGDFAGLTSLRQSFRAAKERKRVLLKAAATEARTQVALEFRKSVDPDGEAWAPLSHRDGMPLRDTGRLANSFTARATENGFIVGTNVAYAKYHQYGTRGRKVAKTRMQAIEARGRFLSRKRASRSKKAFVRVRALTFEKGRVGIPVRRMVPEGRLSDTWRMAILRAVDTAFCALWKK